jgi:hypothetical protein
MKDKILVEKKSRLLIIFVLLASYFKIIQPAGIKIPSGMRVLKPKYRQITLFNPL